MQPIRVLVVDDSVVIRRVVSEELSAATNIVVVGTAANGKIAVAKLAQLLPDLVILDVEMPEMDGLETLKAIRKTHPRLPVVMFSALTEQGATATLDALSLGATDYFTKPSGPNGLDESRRVIREELAPAILTLCQPKPAATTLPAITPRSTSASRIEAVVIGVSTGGPNALAEVFRNFPAQFRVPIFVAQHMPPTFTRMLAERLSATSAIPVTEAQHGTVVQPGHAYIAPGDHHMVLGRSGTSILTILNQDPHENSCRPAADPLFRSASKIYGAGLLAVVLTGMGSDGFRGCETVKAAGGQIFVQDEATSVVWGMPGFIAKAGLAEKVLPLPMIGSEIVRRVGIDRK